MVKWLRCYKVVKVVVILILLIPVFCCSQSARSFQPEKQLKPTDIVCLPESNQIEFLENRLYGKRLLQHIKKAKKHISLGAYLFKLSKNKRNQTVQLLNALIAASKRGVRVEVLLELSDHNVNLNKYNKIAGKELKRHHIKVRFDSRRVQSHSKLVVIDGEWTFAGSHNLTASALWFNNEASLLVRSKVIAEKALLHLSRIR
jgi:phosphatidylserine/phosphatidylglycerophosphate/cardiolipin synthase-like enzyme